jgi:hypothetical protein
MLFVVVIIDFPACNPDLDRIRLFGWIRIYILNTEIRVAELDHISVTKAGAGFAMSYGFVTGYVSNG